MPTKGVLFQLAIFAGSACCILGMLYHGFHAITRLPPARGPLDVLLGALVLLRFDRLDAASKTHLKRLLLLAGTLLALVLLGRWHAESAQGRWSDPG